MTDTENNNDFSITFWIEKYSNPGWNNKDSEVRFPPFTVKNGILVFFSKIRDKLKIYILHPDIGYRKMVTNISSFISQSTFVALTNSSTVSKLYLGTKTNPPAEVELINEPLEVGDYIMAIVKNNEIQGLSIEGDIEVFLPATIKKIKDNRLQLEFFTVGNKTQIIELDKERIKK